MACISKIRKQSIIIKWQVFFCYFFEAKKPNFNQLQPMIFKIFSKNASNKKLIHHNHLIIRDDNVLIIF